MASEAVREKRQKVSDAANDGHRTDWIEAHKSEIQEKLGIDPSNVWEYDSDDASADSFDEAP